MTEFDPEEQAAEKLYQTFAADAINADCTERVVLAAIAQLLMDIYHPEELSRDAQLLFVEELDTWADAYFTPKRGWGDSL